MRYRRFVGIDVHGGMLAVASIPAREGLPESRWFTVGDGDAEQERLRRELVERLALPERNDGTVAIGIDAPRRPLEAGKPRTWRWKGTWQRWVRGVGGRHCEVVLRALKLANPQWSPVGEHKAPSWMKVGFSLFRLLAEHAEVFEVFPAASLNQLRRDATDLVVNVNLRVLGDCPKGRSSPHHMIDAYIAAATVREFVTNRGSRVGGGDGLGCIVLPRPLKESGHGVLEWPSEARKG